MDTYKTVQWLRAPRNTDAIGDPHPGSEAVAPETLVIWVSEPNVGQEAEGIDGFYLTREAAVRGVKQRFGDPYKVSWSERVNTPTGFVLRGEFEAVPGYCTRHAGEWFILPVTVES